MAEMVVIRQYIQYKGFCNSCRISIHSGPVCTERACPKDLMDMDNAVVSAATNYLETGDFEGNAYCKLSSMLDNKGEEVIIIPTYPRVPKMNF